MLSACLYETVGGPSSQYPNCTATTHQMYLEECRDMRGLPVWVMVVESDTEIFHVKKQGRETPL